MRCQPHAATYMGCRHHGADVSSIEHHAPPSAPCTFVARRSAPAFLASRWTSRGPSGVLTSMARDEAKKREASRRAYAKLRDAICARRRAKYAARRVEL